MGFFLFVEMEMTKVIVRYNKCFEYPMEVVIDKSDSDLVYNITQWLHYNKIDRFSPSNPKFGTFNFYCHEDTATYIQLKWG
jgi:hypothetical protein